MPVFGLPGTAVATMSGAITARREVRQVPHGCANCHAAKLGVKVDDRTALAAAKAVPEVLFGVDREARRSLVVQGTQALPAPSVALGLPAMRLAIRQQGIVRNNHVTVETHMNDSGCCLTAGSSSSQPPRFSHVAGCGMYLPSSLSHAGEFRHASSAASTVPRRAEPGPM